MQIYKSSTTWSNVERQGPFVRRKESNSPKQMARQIVFALDKPCEKASSSRRQRPSQAQKGLNWELGPEKTCLYAVIPIKDRIIIMLIFSFTILLLVLLERVHIFLILSASYSQGWRHTHWVLVAAFWLFDGIKIYLVSDISTNQCLTAWRRSSRRNNDKLIYRSKAKCQNKTTLAVNWPS